MLFVGDDWAEAHHDVVVCDEGGRVVARGRFPHGTEGIGRFHEVMATHTSDPVEVVVGIETDRGLWVQSLVAVGYQVYAINPLSVARYRERHTVSGAKSDAGDAKVLADLVRTDRHNHRPMAGDSHLVEAVKVLARAHQNLIWERTRHGNTLRSALRHYYPGALDAFEKLAHPDATAVLGRAPDPKAGRRLTRSQIIAALRRGGRRRNLEPTADKIKEALQAPQLQAPAVVTGAYAATTRATIGIIGELNRHITQLETELETYFEQHPDTDIVLSQPGLGVVLGARVLGEFGDDPNRYATAKSRRNYAGTSPITRSSGTWRTVRSRHIRNQRLITAIDQWAFSTLTTSPGARAFYDQHRAKGNGHHQTLRALGNRLVGILHGCLKHRTHYNEHTAWAHRQPQPKTKAA